MEKVSCETARLDGASHQLPRLRGSRRWIILRLLLVFFPDGFVESFEMKRLFLQS